MDIQFTDNSQEFIDALENAIPRILEAVGVFVEGEAKAGLENDPRRVDTGLLRNSITHAVSGGQPAARTYHADRGNEHGVYYGNMPSDPPEEQAVYIGSNVEYSVFVHEGTSKTPVPNRFLKNAVERNADQIKDYMQKGLENA